MPWSTTMANLWAAEAKNTSVLHCLVNRTDFDNPLYVATRSLRSKDIDDYCDRYTIAGKRFKFIVPKRTKASGTISSTTVSNIHGLSDDMIDELHDSSDNNEKFDCNRKSSKRLRCTSSDDEKSNDDNKHATTAVNDCKAHMLHS